MLWRVYYMENDFLAVNREYNMEKSKADVLVNEPSANNTEIVFQKPEETVPAPTTNTLVQQAFDQAKVHLIKTDENLQGKILDTAQDCIETEIDTLKTDTDTKHTESKFHSAKDACACYLIDEKETTTPTWGTFMMKGGYGLILFIYIIVATFTIAPTMFILKKVQVGIKQTWAAILLALIIYLGVIITPIILTILRTNNII